MTTNSHCASSSTESLSGRRAVLRHLIPDSSALYGVAVLSGVTNLLMLTAPLFMLQVYDRVIPSGSIPTLLTLLSLVAALYLAQSIIDYCRGRVLARLSEALDEKLVTRLFSKDLDRAISDPAKRNSPLNELAVLRRFLSGAGPSALLDAPWIPIYLVILASLHWMLGLFGLFGSIVVDMENSMAVVSSEFPIVTVAGVDDQDIGSQAADGNRFVDCWKLTVDVNGSRHGNRDRVCSCVRVCDL